MIPSKCWLRCDDFYEEEGESAAEAVALPKSWSRCRVVAIATTAVAACGLVSTISQAPSPEPFAAPQSNDLERRTLKASGPENVDVPGWTMHRRLGQPSICQAIQTELNACNGGSCSLALPPAAGCVWEQWSGWTTCSLQGMRKRHRAILSPAGPGGKSCNGPVQQAQPCRADNGTGSMDCQLGFWTPWSDCTKTCQGGQQYHTREIIRQQSGLGAFCSDSLYETRVCKSVPCPGGGAIDCKWAQWSVWSDCTATCGNGEKRRSRAVSVSPSGGGKLCQPLTGEEVARCGGSCGGSVVDCLWSKWTDWSPCSKSCDAGQKFRGRRIGREARAGGNGCRGYFEDYRTCSLASCRATGIDCTFSSWSTWSGCSAPCSGHYSRNRMIASVAVKGGRPCLGPTVAVAPCNVGAPACGNGQADCRYNPWEDWSTCSRSCGGGMTLRKRGIAVHVMGNGKPCSGDMQTVKFCNTDPCWGMLATDCRWSSWSKWSACTLSCGRGQSRRHRTVILEAAAGGKPCKGGDSVQTASCNSRPCLAQKFFCDWANWGPWSQCERGGMSVTCGGGERKRTRTTHLVRHVVSSRRLQGPAGASPLDPYGLVSTQPKIKSSNPPGVDGDTQCRDVQDVLAPCAQSECVKIEPKDCAWALWSEWSSCPCEGIRERHRVITSYASGGGKPCLGSEVLTKPCKARCNQKAAIDCEYSAWSAWAACPRSCGGPFSERFRSIVQYPRGQGRACIVGIGGEKQRQKCNDFQCPQRQDCRWGAWTAYSACSVSCGGGQMSRARNVVVIGKNGGALCDKKDSMVVVACNTQSCPTDARDCEFSTWDDWHGCSQSCGIGTQRRIRVVMVDATEDGRPCSGNLQDFQECNLGRCKPKPVIDCLWATWSTWGACTALCNGHRERNRAIRQFSHHGGRTCEGAERDIRGCNLGSPVCKSDGPQDCVLGTWQVWTSCTKRCEGGQHYRSREVSTPARNFGRPCGGPLQQVQACNTGACAGKNRVNCVWGSWGQWSACTLSCNGGQRMRQRGIAIESQSGGLPCVAQASMELVPCNVQGCMDVLEVCGWAQWNGWEQCSKSCGGGQQQRIRLRRWLPSAIARKKSDAQPIFGPRGIATPQRRLAEPPLLGGPDDCTGSQKEIRPCGIGPCNSYGPAPIACRWGPWSPWGTCTCEGFRERGRSVAQRAQNGGLVCTGPLRGTRACVPTCESKSVDCSFSVWTSWSQCSASCDGGQKYHSRTLDAHAARFGYGCHGRLEEVTPCNTMVCTAPLDCKYGDWARWSSCSKSCDGGQKSRSRTVSQYPMLGGAPCANGALRQVAGCGLKTCSPWSPSDCKWGTWADWHTCSATCGKGRRFRERNVDTWATHNGKRCRGRYQDYQDCKLPLCSKPPTDCTFMVWSTWSQCFDSCAGHKERTRQISNFAVGAGGKPCQGPLRQVTSCAAQDSAACRGKSGSLNCELGDWSLWSACTKSCSGGQHFQHRRVLQQARGSGIPCDTSLKVTAACNTIACAGTDPVDCAWAPWGGFSACTATCGGGEMRRHRSIQTEAMNGGAACSRGSTVDLRPCRMDACDGTGFCTWAPWSAWLECSATCGPGQKRRRRDLRPTATPAPAIGLSMALPRKVTQPRDDFVTAFASRHETAVCGFAVLGAMSVLFGLAHLAAPIVKRTVRDGCFYGSCQRPLSLLFNPGQGRTPPLYAALNTEEVDGGSAGEE